MIGRRELETQTDHLSPVKNEKKNFCQKQKKIVIVFDAFVIRYFFLFQMKLRFKICLSSYTGMVSNSFLWHSSSTLLYG